QAHPRLAVVGDVVIRLLVPAGALVDEPRGLAGGHGTRVAGAVLDHDPLPRRRQPRTLVRVALGDELDLDRMVRGDGTARKSRDGRGVGHIVTLSLQFDRTPYQRLRPPFSRAISRYVRQTAKCAHAVRQGHSASPASANVTNGQSISVAST